MTRPDPALLDEVRPLLDGLVEARRSHALAFPGPPVARQPVHVVYGGAQLFRHDIAARLGKRALKTLGTYAPDAFALAKALDLPGQERIPDKKKPAKAFAQSFLEDPAAAAALDPVLARFCTLYERLLHKLEKEPVEDYRIDFEDGFGIRPDDEEDAVAVVAAMEVAKGLDEGGLPEGVGIRIKAFNEATQARGTRTLEMFLTRLLERTQGKLPPTFVVTLPKVELPEEVALLDGILTRIEARADLRRGRITVELMMETPSAFFDAAGSARLPALLEAAQGRCRGVHVGTHDLLASAGVVGPDTRLEHPTAQAAVRLLQLWTLGRGVFLSDGPITTLPIAPHKAREGALTKKQLRENREAVHDAWLSAAALIRRSLDRGVHQGWDLHPAQIPVRFAATFAYYLEAHEAAAPRLKRFLERAAQATATGRAFDDAATGRALFGFYRRGWACGALGAGELEEAGLTEKAVRKSPDLAAYLTRKS
jgi:citrate lyase beta subunit